MKSPCTAQPCSLSKRAVTAESTPPESPTTIAGLADISEGHRRYGRRGQQVEMGHRIQRLPLAAEVILYTTQDQRAAKQRLALLKVRAGQPMGTNDSVVERLFSLVVIYRAAKSEAHRGDAALGASPQVHANEGYGYESPGSFLANLADDGLQQRLPMLNVSGRLIEDESLIDPLLNYEKAAVALGDGGNGDFGLLSRHV